MDDFRIAIKIIIAERSYSLTINKKDEEKIRKAAAEINQRIKELAKVYAYRDFQDLLAMAALQYANSTIKYESEKTYKDQYLEQKLSELSTLLSDQIDS